MSLHSRYADLCRQNRSKYHSRQNVGPANQAVVGRRRSHDL